MIVENTQTQMRKGILDRIGNGLIDYKPDGDCLGDVEPHRVDMVAEVDIPIPGKAVADIADQFRDIAVHMDQFEVIRLIQPLVDQGHGEHPVPADLHRLALPTIRLQCSRPLR